MNGQGFRRNMPGKPVTRKSEEVCRHISLYGQKNVKILVSSVNGHQMVILPEGNFNERVDRMAYSVLWISISLSQQPLLPLLNGLKLAMMARMDVYAWAQQYEFQLTRPAWLQPLLSAQTVGSRDQH